MINGCSGRRSGKRLIADSRRPKRDRRTATQIYEEWRAVGYDGSYQRVCTFVRSWKQEWDDGPQRGAFVPMSFEYGDAFQCDRSCEYVFICVCARASKSRMSSSLQAGHSGWLGTTPKVTIVAKPASD